MKRYALIKDAVCTNVLIWDGDAPYPLAEGEQLIEHETAGIGWELTDGVLVDPTPPGEANPNPVASTAQPISQGAQDL